MATCTSYMSDVRHVSWRNKSERDRDQREIEIRERETDHRQTPKKQKQFAPQYITQQSTMSPTPSGMFSLSLCLSTPRGSGLPAMPDEHQQSTCCDRTTERPCSTGHAWQEEGPPRWQSALDSWLTGDRRRGSRATRPVGGRRGRSVRGDYHLYGQAYGRYPCSEGGGGGQA